MLMFNADELFEKLGLTAVNCENCKHHNKDYISKCDNSTWRDVCDILDYMTLIDAEPLVRCKDCKYWQPSEYGVVEQPYCKHIGYKEETGLDIRIGNENDYCSYGERKDDDKSCDTCKHHDKGWDDIVCDGCTKAHSNWERKDDE